jgi:energy-coupling factor transport system substrate-specific component
MSWQLVSFAMLAAVLAGGFAWYERSRPPAKIVALVAALAALAVVGRIAFAPIPNVKPTTDIVLFAGYALGPVPGFAVGAVSALVSNIFFGHGPWTPWQMLGWGTAGLIGAGLAAVAGRDLGRIPLALACAFAGAVFGALLDLYQWTQGATHDLAAYLTWSATSLPYNLAHILGNIVFCLLLGPTFVRSLRRFRRRFEVRWAPAAAALLVAVAVAGSLAAPPAAEAAGASARAVEYLRAAQNEDGGFGGAPRSGSTQLHTGWAAFGLAAAGVNPADVSSGGDSIVGYMRANAGGLNDTGDLERAILLLGAAGVSARDFEGRDLVAELLRRRSANGAWKKNVTWTSFGILALRSAGAGAGRSASWLARQQNRDGGFGFSPNAASSVDDTSAALQALGAAGRSGSKTVRRAVRFLRRNQNRDGGFGLLAGQASNSQSTSWVVQGLAGVGRKPSSMRRSPLRYIRSLQSADGSIRYSRSSRQTPVWTTGQALQALAGKAFPIAAVARSADGGSGADEGPGSQAAGRGSQGAADRRGGEDRGASPDAAPPAAIAPAAPAPSPVDGGRADAQRTAAEQGPGDRRGFAWGAALAAAAVAGAAAFAIWRMLLRRRLST